MSRQSKQAKVIALRKQITAEHLAGKKRPGRTGGTGRKGYRHNAERMKRLQEFVAHMRSMVR